MRESRNGMSPRIGMGLGCAVFLLLLPAILPAPCHAADITLSSRTYLLYYEREVPGGSDRKFAPLYEYLSGDAGNLGGKPLSFHFYGGGRLAGAEDRDDGGRGGALASAYLRYLHPKGNAEMRLGRFFFAEGTAAEILDGIYLKARTPAGFGLSVFGGVPVERSITSTDTGDSLYGGRLFFARAGFAEIGVTYLRENGDFQGDDREAVVLDLCVRPLLPLELTGPPPFHGPAAPPPLAGVRFARAPLSPPRPGGGVRGVQIQGPLPDGPPFRVPLSRDRQQRRGAGCLCHRRFQDRRGADGGAGGEEHPA